MSRRPSLIACLVLASLLAAGISCKSLIGLPGLAYKGNLTFMQMYLPLPFAVLIAARYFLPFYVRFRMTSVYEYLGLRFSPAAASVPHKERSINP